MRGLFLQEVFWSKSEASNTGQIAGALESLHSGLTRPQLGSSAFFLSFLTSMGSVLFSSCFSIFLFFSFSFTFLSLVYFLSRLTFSLAFSPVQFLTSSLSPHILSISLSHVLSLSLPLSLSLSLSLSLFSLLYHCLLIKIILLCFQVFPLLHFCGGDTSSTQK